MFIKNSVETRFLTPSTVLSSPSFRKRDYFEYPQKERTSGTPRRLGADELEQPHLLFPRTLPGPSVVTGVSLKLQGPPVVRITLSLDSVYGAREFCPNLQRFPLFEGSRSVRKIVPLLTVLVVHSVDAPVSRLPRPTETPRGRRGWDPSV